MSGDEDTELRDLVAQTLETNGTLGKIRAQLRASVFLALEEQEGVQNKAPFANKALQKFVSTQQGRLAVGLIHEFLEFFELDYSLAVFGPESGASSATEREELARDLDVAESDTSREAPLIAEVLKRASPGQPTRRRSSHDNSGALPDPIPEDLSVNHVQEARVKFDHYDVNKDGAIDKDELRSLFQDLFPHFHRNMLERYVNDEFQAADTDFSSGIEFDEFLGIYRRLFVVCRSVVSRQVADITVTSPGGPRGSRLPVMKGGRSSPGLNSRSEGSGTNSRSEGADDTDDFFDDPASPTSPTRPFAVMGKGGSASPTNNPPASRNGSAPPQTSLKDLPPLGGKVNGGVASLKEAPPVAPKPKLDIPEDEDDYDDDFNSSAPNSARTSEAPGSARTPRGTPRGVGGGFSRARLDSDEIEEEIEEEYSFSGADDLLRSSNHSLDDLTEDRTISQSMAAGADYIEDILP